MLLVVLNHGGLGASGGFIGVDIFFVISGFVITRLLNRSLEDGTFSFFGFWERRIRRIIPASALVCFTIVAASLLLTFPSDTVEIAKSAVAQQLMMANVFFWKTTGYFDGPSSVKPLLHFWSLAVEEQFYLAYPIALFACRNFGVKTRVFAVAIPLIITLAVSEFACRQYPSAAYYLLPSRAWELLLGALLALNTRVSNLGEPLRSAISTVSLVLMICLAVVYDSSIRFPGIAALPPCLLTCIVIWVNGIGSNLGKKLLELPFMVHAGLMSYSLYLWHWPIIAFMRYWLGNDLSPLMLVLWLVVTFLISYLSWRYVETPIRSATAGATRKASFVATCLTLPIVTLIAGLVIAKQGYPKRIPNEVAKFQAAKQSMSFIHEATLGHVREGTLPIFGDTKGDLRCLVWGDSHAMALMPGIDAACKKLGCRGMQATHSATPPLVDHIHDDAFGLGPSNPEFAGLVVATVKKLRIPLVILNASWNKYANEPKFELSLRKTIEEINLVGAKVILVLDVANQDVDVPSALAKRAFFGMETEGFGVSVVTHRQRNQFVNELIKSFANQKAIVTDLEPLFVDSRGTWLAISSGQVLYRDSSHLSIEGGMLLSEFFTQLLTIDDIE